MIVKEVLKVLEEMAPLAYAEDFDNVGLLVGDASQIVTGVLVCHDALEEVIDEAIKKQCNLVVCFHPILFSGLKKITGKNYVERSVIKAIKNDIAIYAMHTALDNHIAGVNEIFCKTLGLISTKILLPKEKSLLKLTTYVPKEKSQALRNVLHANGAGAMGNYEQCSFSSFGTGRFMGNENSHPTIGTPGKLEEVEEEKIEVVFEKHKKQQLLTALFASHPYEEVSYEVQVLENEVQQIGMGKIGFLEKPMDSLPFLKMVKEKVQTQGLRHSACLDKKIHKVAVLGGSGSFAIAAAKAQGADAYITADLKYHDFFQAEGELLLADVGHFESERFVKNYIFEYLSNKITTFAIILSDTNTNPVNYL